MSKPSTDTVTERQVARYRHEKMIPARVTLRFLALLKKDELATLARFYANKRENTVFSFDPNLRRLIRGRYDRIQSERRQRGHIK